MLQFSTILYSVTARLAPRTSWHFTALVAKNFSTAITSEQPAAPIKESKNPKDTKMLKETLQKEEQYKFKEIGSQINVNLSEINENDEFTKNFQAATSVNDLLNMAMLPNLSVPNALKLISRITNEVNSGNSQMMNIETDQRFIHLRKMVKLNINQTKTDTETLTDDLSQYTQLSTPAMINMIASLGEQKQRNLSVLRMLSYNIVKFNMKLNLKQCASLLYSMATLNFLDKVLLEKIMADLLQHIPKNTKVITNKSIITSLGFLQYKNEDVLDAFCDTLYMKSICYRLQDYLSILQTFATLQYKSKKANTFVENFAQQVNSSLVSPAEWVDIVWSLTVLGFAVEQHMKSILDPIFMEKLSDKLNTSKKLKLININAFAQFGLKHYKGPFLNKDSVVFEDISLIRTKTKQAHIDALVETLKNVLPPSHFKPNINTNMGFLLDAEYRIDNQHNFVPEINWNEQSKDVRRIGIMVHDYHDYCRGQNDLVGLAYLHTQLLKAQGYNLLTISYENFSTQDKLEKRVSYLKQCMKNVSSEKRST